MTTLTVLTILRLVHLTGLIMGFGGAVLADYTIFSHGVIRPVGNYTIFQTRLLSHIVSIGLCILWVSGFALIMVKLQFQPDFMQNPKVWAKIVVVVMLTINGILVHRFIFPLVTRSQGRRLFDGLNVRQIAGPTFPQRLPGVMVVAVCPGQGGWPEFHHPSCHPSLQLTLHLFGGLAWPVYLHELAFEHQLAAKQSAELDMTAKSWDEQIAALREGAVIGTRHGDDSVRNFAHFRN